MKRIIALLTLIALPTLALAQTWPELQNVYVNDYAEVIDDDAEARMRTLLETLKAETGIEASVLALNSRVDFQTDGGSLADFGIGLINHWGIGDAEKNNGILIMVLVDDREMTVELGAAYTKDDDLLAADVIDATFTPAFQNDDYSGGIERGTSEIIASIAGFGLPADAVPVTTTTQTDSEGGGIGGWILGGLGALFALGVGWGIFGRRIKDSRAVCPSCGKQGMNTETNVVDKPTLESAGKGEKIVTCTHCDHREVSSYDIAKLVEKPKEETGGGKSEGGGASGKW